MVIKIIKFTDENFSITDCGNKTENVNHRELGTVQGELLVNIANKAVSEFFFVKAA